MTRRGCVARRGLAITAITSWVAASAVYWAVSTAAATSAPARPSDAIDLNSASEDEIAALPWVGPLLAEAIVRERRLRGPFRSAEDLRRIDGIDDDALAALAAVLPQAPGERAAVEMLWRVRPEHGATTQNGSAALTVRAPDGRQVAARLVLARPSDPPRGTLTAVASGMRLEIWRGLPRRVAAPSTRPPSATAVAQWVAVPPAGLADGARLSGRTHFGWAAAWCGRASGTSSASGPEAAPPLFWGLGADVRAARGTRAAIGVSAASGGAVVVGEAVRAVRLFAGEATFGIRATPSVLALAAIRSGMPETGWDVACDLGWPLRSRSTTPPAPWLRVRASHDAPRGATMSASLIVTQQDTPGAFAQRARWRLSADGASRPRGAAHAPLARASITASGRDALDDDDPGSQRVAVSVAPGGLEIGAAVATRGAGAWSMGWTAPLASGRWRIGGAARVATPAARAPLPVMLPDLRFLAPAGAGIDFTLGTILRVAAVALDAAGVLSIERGGVLRVRAAIRAAAPRAAASERAVL